MKTAKQLLIDALRSMGADGLCNHLPCGCSIDDLAPCCCCIDGWMNLDDCVAARRKGDDFYPMEEEQ